MTYKYIKDMLFEEIDKIKKENKENENTECLTEMIKATLEDITGDNYVQMKQNNEFAPIMLETIYRDDPEKAQRLSNKLLNCLHQLAHLQSKEIDYKEDNSFIYQERKLKDIRKELEDELENLNNTPNIDKEDNINRKRTYFKIINSLRYNQIISAREISIISELMKERNIPVEDQIVGFELLKLHNMKITEIRKNYNIPPLEKYTVLEMLSRGLEYIQMPVLENESEQKRVEVIAKTYLSSIKDNANDLDSIIENFPKIENGDYSIEEFDAIMKYILIDIQNEINENILSIRQEEFYMDKQIKDMIVKDYNSLSIKYSKIRQYHLDEIENYGEKLIDKDLPEEKSINKLFYSSSTGELGKKSYLEKDIEDLPEEYLYKVRLLLSKLKQDSLSRSEIKKLNNNKNVKNLIELRDDQIRIMFYHISSNNYLIVGCGDKRSNNDINLYRTMGNRNKTIDIDTPENYEKNLKNSEEVEESINNYIEEHQRKVQR